jgi:hypothetical protein
MEGGFFIFFFEPMERIERIEQSLLFREDLFQELRHGLAGLRDAGLVLRAFCPSSFYPSLSSCDRTRPTPGGTVHRSVIAVIAALGYPVRDDSIHVKDKIP